MLCCAIKPMCGWNCERSGSTCRERCGGQGYLSCNRFGDIIGFAHATVTAEGDNRVLMQKVAKELLSSTNLPSVKQRMAAAQRPAPQVLTHHSPLVLEYINSQHSFKVKWHLCGVAVILCILACIMRTLKFQGDTTYLSAKCCSLEVPKNNRSHCPHLNRPP